jgi:hypothetical protein
MVATGAEAHFRSHIIAALAARQAHLIAARRFHNNEYAVGWMSGGGQLLEGGKPRR